MKDYLPNIAERSRGTTRNNSLHPAPSGRIFRGDAAMDYSLASDEQENTATLPTAVFGAERQLFYQDSPGAYRETRRSNWMPKAANPENSKGEQTHTSVNISQPASKKEEAKPFLTGQHSQIDPVFWKNTADDIENQTEKKERPVDTQMVVPTAPAPTSNQNERKDYKPKPQELRAKIPDRLEASTSPQTRAETPDFTEHLKRKPENGSQLKSSQKPPLPKSEPEVQSEPKPLVLRHQTSVNAEKHTIKELQPPAKARPSTPISTGKPATPKLVIGQIKVEVVRTEKTHQQKAAIPRRPRQGQALSSLSEPGNRLLFKQRFGLGQL